MGDAGPPDRAGQLAAELAALRADAGNPSFRKMAERSGCISHTTLHEAVKGVRFPSWETTREFAKACGADETHWRQRWEELKGLSRPEAPAVAAPVPAAGPDAPGPADIQLAPRPERRPKRRTALIVAGAVVVALAAVAALLVTGRLDGVTPAVDVGARIEGDNSKFIADVTVPDGTPVRAGVTVLKVWELQNTGSIPWHERYLRRMDVPPAPGACRTPERVLIGDTAPGDHVMVSVPVTASDQPGRCWIGWKMVDASGREFFTTRRPVYVLVTVVP
ncbi:NBR1-Ig-like domain-containing protein [Amycolatopsis sp. PS_44_ISF1]|uniref:NBR1-Ig-like domain-containing protein n=1 Tax=Amycolatopsis sp. PS_44_ISF1 TaxID=2974917 RepID=UPI0028DEB3B9|nr:NBR1-Ig-like domain-containing protein [Amycolatopsis sp. PS_44_ISF1]MDT8909504.1 NBR1-Ig-like domain-containing protein [Amycolatopsis sp. PS_44_ISF1]